MKNTISRRRFFKTGALAVVGGWAVPNILPARVLGLEGATPPSKKIGLGIIGCGGRGRGGIDGSGKLFQVAAVCDPVRSRREASAAMHGGCAAYNDLRELLANPAVDAVLVSTADYWHVPATLLAVKAGKHCYTEKPLGVSIREALACRDAFRKSGLVFQYGTMQRSGPTYRQAMRLVLGGHIGDVKEIWCLSPPGSTNPPPSRPGPVPEGVDWNLWLGPAPETPFDEARFDNSTANKASYFNYDYTVGFLGGFGSHSLDILQWWADLAGRGVPVEISGTGNLNRESLYNTVSHWDVTARYADGFSMRFTNGSNKAAAALKAPQIDNQFQGNIFIGDKGWLFVNRLDLRSHEADYQTLMRIKFDAGADPIPVSAGGHGGNFCNAILGKEKPVAPIESAVKSDIISHISDIAIRLKRPVRWDPEKATIVSDDEAAKMMHRPMREPFSLEAIAQS